MTTLRDATPRDIDAIFEINAHAVPGVSALTPAYFETLINECAQFRLVEVRKSIAGYLCAMNRHAAYDGEEFQRFREHFRGNFLYVDQLAIARDYRGSGLGRALHDDLEKYASRSGINRLTCEVNYNPINAESQVFHRQCGFAEVGRMETRGVVVSLLAKTGFSQNS